MNYSLIELTKIVQGTTNSKKNRTIDSVFIDSREIRPSKQALFFALNGNRNNGHDYIINLIEAGVHLFVVNADWYKKFGCHKVHSKACFIVVENTLTALHQLAQHHRNTYNIEVIGITGSNGKTIVKEWLYQMLQYDIVICKNPGSYNSQVGVPLSVLQLNKKHKMGIFEAGISLCNEMDHLEKIIDPTTGIFTNIGTAHQENFKSQEQKINEKFKLFKNVNSLYFASNNLAIAQAAKNLERQNKCKLIHWAFNAQNATLNVSNIIRSENTSYIDAHYNNSVHQLRIPFTDDASIENCIMLWLYLLHNNMPPSVIQDRILKLNALNMRMEVKEGINNCRIINDCYNSDIDSLTIALKYQNRQNLEKTLILSDILQSGKTAAILYKEVASIVELNGIKHFIGIGEQLHQHQELFDSIESSIFYKTTADYLKSNRYLSLHRQSILLKGARGFEFEAISKKIEKVQHRTVLEINLSNFVHNLNYYKSLLASNAMIMVMVKAHAYGNGSFEIARLLQHHNIDYLGVAYIDEGKELRKSGITIPIMVMNPEFNSFGEMIEHNLEPEIYNLKGLQCYHETACKYGKHHLPIHLKIETGMNRLGFCEDEIDDLLAALQQYNRLKVKSVFSHLAGSDEDALNDFTAQQIANFTSICKKITKQHSDVIQHISNSSGAVRHPAAHFDMVRLGIGLYGVGVQTDNKLKAVSRFKSVISQIKTVKANQTIGYGRNGLLQQTTKIATVAIGYADGLKRLMGNRKGFVYINKQKAEIIGNICMDMCMIDVNNINVKEGDEVIIFGNPAMQEPDISTVAEICQTIPYEILTGISHRVKRIYYEEE